MAFEMTVDCVNHVLSNFSSQNIKIVIVDNASSNGSGLKLRQEFQNNANVIVLINHQNLGFAQGNNIGYLYLKANFTCDFIIVMNNDVLIEQKDFLSKITEIYNKFGFAILGPDIYSPKLKDSQSPTYRNDTQFLYGRPYKNVLEIFKNYRKFNSMYFYYWFRHYFFGWLRLFFPKKAIKENKTQINSIDYSKDLENVVLHGACYIFSKDFQRKRHLAFNPDTFLYFEEDILHYECKKQNMKMLYSPRIKVIHLEDVSTDSVYKTSFKKTKFINRNMEKSLKVFLDMAGSTD